MINQQKRDRDRLSADRINTTTNQNAMQLVTNLDIPANYNMPAHLQPPAYPSVGQPGNLQFNQPQFVQNPNIGIPALSENRPLLANGRQLPMNPVNYPNLDSVNNLNQAPYPIQYPLPTQSQFMIGKDPYLIPAEQLTVHGGQGSEIPFYRIDMKDVEPYNNDLKKDQHN